MGLFRLIFSKYKHLVYTAFGYENYFKIAGKLKENGVPYQTDIKRNLTLIKLSVIMIMLNMIYM